MATKRLLAFDLGASSGRAMAGLYDGNSLRLEEVSRFENRPVTTLNHRYWNLLGLYNSIIDGMRSFYSRYDVYPDSIGIDSWGVDFVLLDRNNELVQNGVQYRDARSDGMVAVVDERVGKMEHYERTGIARQPFNTVYHLLGILEHEPWILDSARRLLMIPDFFTFLLTGSGGGELTNASTTGLLDRDGDGWALDIIQKLALPAQIFPTPAAPPLNRGGLRDEVLNDLGWSQTPSVFSVASHDTAAAVVALPTDEPNPLFLSSGTWSLLGIVTDRPVTGPLALSEGITNERAADGRYRVLRNIMGMWLFNECRRYWRATGDTDDLEELMVLMEGAEPFRSLIDPDHPLLYPPGDMPARIQRLCRESGQPVPIAQGAILRTIFESLAMKYRYYRDILADLTGLSPQRLHVVGGGSRNQELNRMTADACGLEIVCGPDEATAMGNCISQLLAAGELDSWRDGHVLASSSIKPSTVSPQNEAEWDSVYRQRFRSLVSVKA